MQKLRDYFKSCKGAGRAPCTCLGAVVSDAGVMPCNEDNFLLDGSFRSRGERRSSRLLKASAGQWIVAGVFDGMGGGEGGELAALSTARIFSGLRQEDPDGMDAALHRAFLEANRAVTELRRELQVLGTTATVLVSDGQRFRIYHLGDSRAWLCRGDAFRQLTRDQTLARMRLDAGVYEADSPGFRADAHRLTDYVGRDWTLEHLAPTRTPWTPLEPGDRFLLCSDGVYGVCTGQQLHGCVSDAASPEAQARRLVAGALEQGSTDNATALVLHFS